MEFRRIPGLPPYVFTIIDGLKIEARRAGQDVDRPRLRQPRPAVARDRGREAGRGGAQHAATTATRPAGASPSCARRSPSSTSAGSASTLDPDTEVHLHHRRQGGLQPPDVGAAAARRRRARAVARPTRSTSGARYFAGADARQVADRHRRGLRRERDGGLGVRLAQAAGDRAVVPAQPDHGDASSWPTCSGWSTGPASATSCSCTTSPTPTSAFDGYQPPSILQAEGAKECAVELYSMTKSFSMAGWRVAFLVGNARGRRRAGQAEELPRLRHLPADPDRGHRHAERGARLPGRGQRDLPVAARRAVRRAGPHRLGRSSGRAARCSSGRRSPSRTAEMGSIEFAKLLVTECDVARVARRRLRPGRRRLRAVRPDRERAAHRPGRPQAQARPPQARLTPAVATRSPSTTACVYLRAVRRLC